MIQYILECIAFQLVFLIIYDVFLKRETFFQWNRAYLIGTYIISMIIPWVKIEAMKTTVPETFQAYPEFLWHLNDGAVLAVTAAERSFSISWEYALLFSGMIISALFFGYKLWQIRALKQKGEVHYFEDFTRIIVANSTMAFSFFKAIFLGDKVLEKEHQNILQHELVHIRQRHSYDLIFFELMRIVGWFNPLVYVYQSRVSELHEFIADAQVAKTDRKEQYQRLLSEVFQTQHISFINQFFKSSLIKKRIVMLQKSKSKKIWQLKYLLLLPLVFGMLAYTSIEVQDQDLIIQDQSLPTDEIIIVNDIQNLTATEENKIYKKLKALSLGSEDWVLIVKDINSSLKFVKANDGSFLSGPNNEQIAAKLIYDSELSEADKNSITEFLKKKETSNAEIQQATIQYNQLVAERNRLMQSTNEKNPIIVNLDEQLSYLRKSISNSSEASTNSSVIDAGTNTYEGMSTGNVVSQYNQLVAERNRLMQSRNEKNPIIVNLDQQISMLRNKAFGVSETEATGDGEIIPFAKVEEVPVFMGCENDADKRGCFYENMREHIRKNFNYPKEAQELGVQGRVSVMFTMNTEGDIVAIKTRGPHKSLEDEAVRIISKLPKLKPGVHEGKVVNVSFSIPISFKLSGNDTKSEQTDYENSIDVPFSVVEEVPIFPGCEDASERRACFNDKMQLHISKNFRYPKEALEKGIQGKVFTLFIIAKDGSIQNLRMRSPDSLLENEVSRIINRLPKMTPGKQKGKAVNVPFSIPISFKLQSSERQPDLKKLENMKESKPLLIIDGVESYSNSINDIETSEIESINVLKDKAATKKYGDKGENGVIEVITKKKD